MDTYDVVVLGGGSAAETVATAVGRSGREFPIDVLTDVVHAFPTLSEIYEPPLHELAATIRRKSTKEKSK